MPWFNLGKTGLLSKRSMDLGYDDQCLFWPYELGDD